MSGTIGKMSQLCEAGNAQGLLGLAFGSKLLADLKMFTGFIRSFDGTPN